MSQLGASFAETVLGMTRALRRIHPGWYALMFVMVLAANLLMLLAGIR